LNYCGPVSNGGAIPKMQFPKIIGLWSAAPGCGKTTAAQLICNETGVHCILPFAKPLKQMVIQLLIAAGYTETAANQYVYVEKQKPLTLLPGCPTARFLLQTLGTQWGRQIVADDLWRRVWMLQAHRHEFVIADDVRFPNEAKAVIELGGKMWCITRPGCVDVTGHESESGLGDIAFDRVIVNDGTAEDLRGKIRG